MSVSTPSSVFLNPGVQAELTRLSEHAYPREACGLLIGSPGHERVSVYRVHPARNLSTERACDRYELDPADQLEATVQARRAGLDVVGIWHTHPDRPASPSETDRRAAWPGWSYVITSVRRGQVEESRSWRLHQDRFHEEQIFSLTTPIGDRLPTLPATAGAGSRKMPRTTESRSPS